MVSTLSISFHPNCLKQTYLCKSHNQNFHLFKSLVLNYQGRNGCNNENNNNNSMSIHQHGYGLFHKWPLTQDEGKESTPRIENMTTFNSYSPLHLNTCYQDAVRSSPRPCRIRYNTIHAKESEAIHFGIAVATSSHGVAFHTVLLTSQEARNHANRHQPTYAHTRLLPT